MVSLIQELLYMYNVKSKIAMLGNTETDFMGKQGSEEGVQELGRRTGGVKRPRSDTDLSHPG